MLSLLMTQRLQASPLHNACSVTAKPQTRQLVAFAGLRGRSIGARVEPWAQLCHRPKKQHGIPACEQTQMMMLCLPLPAVKQGRDKKRIIVRVCSQAGTRRCFFGLCQAEPKAQRARQSDLLRSPAKETDCYDCDLSLTLQALCKGEACSLCVIRKERICSVTLNKVVNHGKSFITSGQPAQ